MHTQPRRLRPCSKPIVDQAIRDAGSGARNGCSQNGKVSNRVFELQSISTQTSQRMTTVTYHGKPHTCQESCSRFSRAVKLAASIFTDILALFRWPPNELQLHLFTDIAACTSRVTVMCQSRLLINGPALRNGFMRMTLLRRCAQMHGLGL